MPGSATWSLVRVAGPSAHAPADDFAFDERGHLRLDHTAATPMITALTQHLAAWWAHPDHGSRIADILAGEPDPDPVGALTSAVHQALAPLERAHRIQDLEVRVTLDDETGDRGRVRVTITAHDTSRAMPVTLTLDPL